MRLTRALTIALIVSFPSSAFAWDFGRRVRGPDYLDPYLYTFGFLTVLTLLAVMMTKPSSVPMRELYRAELPRLCKVYHRMFCLVAVPFLGILLVGPGILIYERDFATTTNAEVAATPRTSLTSGLAGALSARSTDQNAAPRVRTSAGGAKFVTVGD